MGQGVKAIDRQRLIALFCNMVDIYSPSGKEEELTVFLDDYISAFGLRVMRQTVDETRANLLVSRGSGVAKTLFLGHIDTVPAFDFEHYGYEESGGECRGLGTADMKSGCAAMIEAFIGAFKDDSLTADVMLALVVGEEESGDGTQALLASHSFAQALVAEPTNLQPCLDHYGYVEMLVRAFGYRRHAALSGRDTNAIRAMLHLLLRLEEQVERDEPDTVLNIRDLHSSESGFAVPDRCAASVDFHLPPDISTASYAQKWRTLVEKELINSGASRYEVEFPTMSDGFRMASDQGLPLKLQRIFKVMGFDWAPGPFRSHSDANLLHEAGCKPVMLGPGLLARAHTRDEAVALEQVFTAAEIYKCLLSVCA